MIATKWERDDLSFILCAPVDRRLLASSKHFSNSLGCETRFSTTPTFDVNEKMMSVEFEDYRTREDEIHKKKNFNGIIGLTF